MQMYGGKIFLNQQSGIRLYMKSVMIMGQGTGKVCPVLN
jgi:hypothetical protein